MQLYCITAVISAPTDVHVRRLSLTAVEVTWNPPAFHGVAGYRVEYGAMTDDNQQRPKFLDTGPYTVAQVNQSINQSINQ